jgi:NAD(P)-dependent dehydrogenase (short-subunit alcohol dehydrogenase family)
MASARRSWEPPTLTGRVALVTGASRGVGKGIALVLGECGATVYVTGRSTRQQPGALAGTVDDTAEQVSARGGRGVPVPTDHTDDDQVEALFARVRREEGGLDLLVANAWGGYEGYDDTFSARFWEQPLWRWDAMFHGGLRAQFTAARLAAPLMIERGRGIVVCTGGNDDLSYYLGNVPYDVVKAATVRLVTAAARELRSHNVAVVGVYPGFTRTEAVVEAYAAAGKEPPEETHSPEFVGRAVAHVLADPDVMELSGSGAQAAEYARRYGFRDTDGRKIAPFVLPETLRLSTSQERS